MIKNLFKFAGFFILSIGAAILADQILWPYFVERPLFLKYNLSPNPVYVTEKKEITIQENVALTNAAVKAAKTIVGVRTKIKTGQILEGSALALTNDGLVVTLAGLVPLGGEFSFFSNAENFSYQVLKRDTEENLALIKLEKASLSPVSFADPGKMRLGERLFLVGLLEENKIAKKIVEEGIIRSFDETAVETNIKGEANLAGTPLFNIEGSLLGINTVERSGRITAIPVAIIRQFTGF